MKLIKVLALSLLLVGMMVVVAAPLGTAQAADPVTLTVYNPTGAFEVTQVFAPRVDDLNGKTICEVTNDSWEDTRTFPLIQSLLQKQFPTAKFITGDKFPHGIQQMTSTTSGLDKKLKDAGCQAAIVGNAG